ncbi:hypothetical protein QQP08_008353 [Theobroma cacao]|nr:hypothetical protein QQP08_008353 [Theobroma cacao]
MIASACSNDLKLVDSFELAKVERHFVSCAFKSLSMRRFLNLGARAWRVSGRPKLRLLTANEGMSTCS